MGQDIIRTTKDASEESEGMGIEGYGWDMQGRMS